MTGRGVRWYRTAEQIADTMFALATPSRVQILMCLLDGPHDVSQLTDALDMQQSAVSHQLRLLRELRLVEVTRDGRRRVYELADEHVAALVQEAIRHVEQRQHARRLVPRVKRLGT